METAPAQTSQIHNSLGLVAARIVKVVQTEFMDSAPGVRDRAVRLSQCVVVRARNPPGAPLLRHWEDGVHASRAQHRKCVLTSGAGGLCW